MPFTRRTHIVRISDAKPGDPPSDTYFDIEVLDAISFRVENGGEVVLSMKSSNSAPYIIDDTGGGHGKQPGKPTQRTHMKRIVSKTDASKKIDVEVMDVMAFTDQNGGEWILDMQATTGSGPSIFDQTDGSGDNQATRRMHDEKVSDPFGQRNPENYVTSQRCDAIAFRKVNGQEVIVSCPSNDDPNSPGARAATFVSSPQGYDPADDSENAVIPPANKDEHNYISFVKDASGISTGSEKISMGPFWWIRKMKENSAYILFHLSSRGAPPGLTLRQGNTTIVPLFDLASQPLALDQITWYVWQPATSGVISVLIEGGIGSVTWGSLSLPDAIAGKTVMGYGANLYGDNRISPVRNFSGQFWPPYDRTTFPPFFFPNFDTEGEAQAYANFLNAWSAREGVTPQLAVGGIEFRRNLFHRDVIIKCSASTTIFADASLAPDPNDPSSLGGGIQAQIYSVDPTSKLKVPSVITLANINDKPFLFNSESVGSGQSTTYTVITSRDTDLTDLVLPAKTVRLFVDVTPPRIPDA